MIALLILTLSQLESPRLPAAGTGPRICAHRGDMAQAPENTLAAIRSAAAGIDYILTNDLDTGLDVAAEFGIHPVGADPAPTEEDAP